MRVYVAGPMTGIAEFNFPAFIRAVQDLRYAGHEAVSPTDNGVPLDAPWQDHMRADIRLLLDCDAIHLLPGWESSRGASLEQSIAAALSMPVVSTESAIRTDTP